MEGLGGFLLFGIGIAVYLLPTIVGSSKSNIGAIFVLNLFLGWTLIGWVVALVWALTNDDPKVVAPQPDKIDQLKKLKELKDSGVLTETEYTTQKAKILS